MVRFGSTLSRLFSRSKSNAKPRLRLLMWATLAGLVFGTIEFGEPLEDHLRIARNGVRQHKASGETVIVGFDDKSLRHLNSWPWPRRTQAALIRNLEKLGAEKILFDLDFSSRSNLEEDRAFASGLAEANRKVILSINFVMDPLTGERRDNYPLPEFRKHAGLAHINFRYNMQMHVWELPYALQFGGESYPSLSSEMAGVNGPSGETFPIDYAIDPRTIPVISAIDVVEGKVSAEQVRGKRVVIGTTSHYLGDIYFLPGYVRLPGVYLHAMGAETLRKGAPVKGGWLIPYLLAVMIGVCSLRIRHVGLSLGMLGAAAVTFLVLPLVLEGNRVSIQIVPALFLLLVVGGSLAWTSFRQAYRLRGTVNVISGLPNLNALRQEEVETDRPLIAARILNYAEITSSLPPEDEKALVEQIAGRLCVGSASRKLYQGDEGIFAWFEEPAPMGIIGEHLEAVHALFRSPIVVAGNRFDLSIAFGLDAGNSRLHANRLGSSLVAAEEAANEGLKWKEYDPEKLKEASWKLSLLSQLDSAIDAEELWIAYQPKLDLKTGRITGAEALVRWTHAERGPVSPMEFVVAAEQSDRIEKLTSYVLDRAVAVAAAINGRGIEFELSVNLSARLIDNAGLAAMVTRILQKHGLAANRLTLEVTETAALNTSGNLEALLELRYSGVQISIDDYGTGLSTLDYLKRIPATEIKIDKSFVQALGRSRSDKLLVHSTIQLAHSLGQKVVAEGIEDRDTLDALSEMGCDVAQGYFIGKPMKYTSLLRFLIGERKRRAA
jgi:EAL domain-containing protein (putative c-di-GMP-specific phosphodiesterase class I)/CHASE2 domain-containing sensor protein